MIRALDLVVVLGHLAGIDGTISAPVGIDLCGWSLSVTRSSPRSRWR